MIQFDIPPFFGIRLPRYRREDGPYISAVRRVFPLLRRDLYRILHKSDACRKAADRFNLLIFLTYFACICAGISLALGLIAWYYFHSYTYIRTTLMMLAITCCSSYLAYSTFKRMVKLFQRWQETQGGDIYETRFKHYDVTPEGIKERHPTQ